MVKKTLISLLFFKAILLGQETKEQSIQNQTNFIEQIKQKEAQAAVPRETVPVEESKFLIDTPIPKTAHYLPFLQTLLNIEVGTLPNPIGVSFIGSHSVEKYRVKKFNAQAGKTLTSLKGLGSLFNPSKHEWKLSVGKVEIKTSAIGIKTDVFLFPFMQLFFTGAYLHMEQKTEVGNATIPFTKQANSLQQGALKLGLVAAGIKGGQVTANNMTVPVAPIENTLDGWLVMGGTNLAVGYKGFFASLMLSGGYVQLDDRINNVTGFVQKPFMYIAPRIGYNYHGIVTAHVGVQRVELFGATEGKDLSKSTGGLVAGYSVEIEKFPINFLAGIQFMFARDMGVSIEYVGSPDVNGFNAELAYRF